MQDYDFTTIQFENEDFVYFETDNPIFNLETCEDECVICAKNVFGVPSLYPWQRLAIANILDGVRSSLAHEETVKNKVDKELLNDVLDTSSPKPQNGKETIDEYKGYSFVFDEDAKTMARQIILLPTGAGKSLCFQIPALLLPGVTLVVYPLLALMSDQVRRLREVGVEPILLRGEQSEDERARIFERLDLCEKNPEDSDVKIIIANPEILQSEKILSRLESLDISHIAIDEAHCVSEWGDTFRPTYLELEKVITRLKPKAVTAFTATASPTVLNRISEILFGGRAHIIRGETDRENITYFVKQCRVKPPVLLETLKVCQRPAVIFSSSREGCEHIAKFIRYRFGTDEVKYYHAGLERAEKDKTEKWFNQSDTGILVATCAWGMGVDKKNIRTVIHYEAPQTVEAYVQEAGRGGRDGLPSKAILLWSHEDLERLSQTQTVVSSRAQAMIEYAQTKTCRRKLLLKTLGDVNESSIYEHRDMHACSGCDVCDKSAQYEASDEKKLLYLLRKNEKVFTRHDIIDSVKNPLWRATDVNKLINILKSEKKIREDDSVVWKNKLSTLKPISPQAKAQGNTKGFRISR